jgi:Arc/MetJ family transcription regulator
MKRVRSSNKAKNRSGPKGRTNIVLDTKLVSRVKRLAGVATAREAVQIALEHYARSRDYSGILALHGTDGVAEGYDPKASAPSEA